MTAAAPRVRRARSLTESLLSIVLTLEAILVFFIALTVFGLHALSPAEAFGGGAALAILLLAATRVMRYSWGVWIGWLLQLVILATGLVLAALYIAALFFIAMWVFCFVRGRQIDRQNQALNAASEQKETP